MKYGGSFTKNFSSANGSNNMDYQKDVLLDEIARLIEFNKPIVISILKDSGHSISPKSSKKQVVDHVVKALYGSQQFRTDIAKEIAKANQHEFANAIGDWKIFGGAGKGTTTGGGASGAGQGATAQIGADPISAIAGAIGSIFSFASANQNKKAEEERTRQAMYDKLLNGGEEKNWMPIIVVSGILLIGGIVAYFALRKK